MAKKGDRKERFPKGDTGDPQGMAALAVRFTQGLQHQNFSTHTIAHHSRYLEAFLAWACDRGIARPTEVTKPILERYQRFLFLCRKTDGEPLAPATQKCYLVAVRAWFKWLARHNH